MPTARELLAQADALMRRNRARAVDTDVPELPEAMPAPVVAPAITLDDIPELTDAVEEIEIASILELPDDGAEPTEWGHDESVEPASAAPAAPEPPPPTSHDGGTGARVFPLFANAMTSEPVVPPAMSTEPVVAADASDAQPDATKPARVDSPPADDWARWEALAEEIRMQVLQRIDIFTDTGLREQLSVQLRPIVERASAEMVVTVNDQVGKLLRAYIAEAIEREIEKWRRGSADAAAADSTERQS